MSTSQPTAFFEFVEPKKYQNNGLGFSLNPKPHYEVIRITAHNPQKNETYPYNSLDDLSEFCPISFNTENDKLHIAAQKVQRINIWQPGRQSPVMRYDSRSFMGFQVRQGECILELILYPSAGSIRIHMNLSNPKLSVESTFEEKEPVKQQITSNVDSNSTITGLQEQLNPTPEKKSNRPTIKPPHQEDESASSVQQEPIEPQTTVGSEPSPNNAETSSEQFQQIEAIVDGLLSRLDAVDTVVEALIEQQKAHNEKQTKLAEDIEAVVPNLQSMLSQQ